MELRFAPKIQLGVNLLHERFHIEVILVFVIKRTKMHAQNEKKNEGIKKHKPNNERRLSVKERMETDLIKRKERSKS